MQGPAAAARVPSVTRCAHDFRHGRRPAPASYRGGVNGRRARLRPDGGVSDEGLTWLAGVGGLLAWAAAIYPAATSEHWRHGVSAAWWAVMAAFVVIFAGSAFSALGARWERAAAMALVALFGAAMLAAPGYGMNGILAVVSVVCVAFAFPLPLTLAVVAGQAVLLGASIAAWSGVPGEATLWVLAYGGMQLFAVVMVEAGLRETRAREALAAAQAQLAEASRAEERLRIARDLHDQIGHQLTALALNLEAATHLAAGTPAARPVETCRSLAKDTLADVRTVVGRLREEPSTSYDGAALARRLEALAAAVPSLRVRVRVLAPGPWSLIEYEALLRAAQEALTNTARHARARELLLQVQGEDGETVLTATDDGVGADQDVAASSVGHGLRGMRERFADLGGVVLVSTAPGAGFRLVARLPRGSQ